MKYLIALHIFIFVIVTTFAQSTVSGYYITQNNDTIKADIRIRKGLFGQANNDFTKKVQVIDSNNTALDFTPNDIKGYGFTNEDLNYTFVSKPIKDGTNKFLSPVFVGPKSSLYQYGIYIDGTGGAFSSNQVFYTFEKADSTYLFLRNILNKKFKSELKDFYKDNLEVQQLIDTKLQYWLELNNDLNLIFNTYNKN